MSSWLIDSPVLHSSTFEIKTQFSQTKNLWASRNRSLERLIIINSSCLNIFETQLTWNFTIFRRLNRVSNFLTRHAIKIRFFCIPDDTSFHVSHRKCDHSVNKMFSVLNHVKYNADISFTFFKSFVKHTWNCVSSRFIVIAIGGNDFILFDTF